MLPRKGILEALKKRLESEAAPDRQVLLSFLSDPYCREESRLNVTRPIIELLAEYQIPVAVLTKGGTRAIRDIDVFKKFNRFQLGATLTFDNAEDSTTWEPGAASPENRIEMLKEAHDAGLRTFVSFEPVINPGQSLHLMELAAPYIQHYKIGRWNHDTRANKIDWQSFGVSAVEFCRANKKTCYIKDDLAKALPENYLYQTERNPDLMEV
jgi:DNA repair photolyase